MAFYNNLKKDNKKPSSKHLKLATSLTQKTVNLNTQQSQPTDQDDELTLALLEMSPFIISISTISEGRLLNVNQRWCKVLGLNKDDVIGRRFEDLGIHIDPNERQRLLDTIEQYGEIKNFETRLTQENNPPYDTRMWVKKINYQGQKCLLNITTYSNAFTQTMEAVHQSEKRFRNILTSINESYYEVDLKGNITFLNNTVKVIFGRYPEELIGTNFKNYTLPEDVSKVMEAYEEVYQGISAVKCVEYGILHKDGTSVQVETSASLLRDNNGQPIGFYGIIRDRTEQKKAEDALRRSEEKYRTILEEMKEGYYELDLEGNYTYFNKAELKLRGYNADELMGASYRQYLSHEQAAKITKIFSEIRRTGKPLKLMGFETVRKDGSSLFVEVSAYPLKDTFGQIIGYWGITRDRTEEKKAELALKKSEEQYRLLVNNANDGIYLTQNGRIKYHNPKTSEITGFSNGALAGMLFADLVHPEDKISIYNTQLQKLETGQTPGVFSFRIFNHAKKILWVELNPITITWDGKIAALNFLRDVTHQKKIEAQLLQSQKMEAIGTLAGGIAHDFNNILGSMIGFTELTLEDVSKDSLLADNLSEVLIAGKRAKGLVKQILTFARQSDEKVEPVIVSIIAKEALRLIRSSLPTTITIQSNIASKSPILGNPTQIHQIIMNLCANAAHAMEYSGGLLSVDLTDHHLSQSDESGDQNLPAGTYLKLSISDTGCGISPELLHNIFEPYFTTKGPGEGTGMGLSVVQGIVENYGGQITVKSKLGEGTIFTIYFPISDEVATPALPSTERRHVCTERILLVDDELSILKMGQRILTRQGYQVTTQNSSLEALKLFSSNPKAFDLIITDMTMPDMTGDRLARNIMTLRPEIPIILCTGYSRQINEETAEQIGIKAFAYKPLVKKELTDTVRKVLDQCAINN